MNRLLPLLSWLLLSLALLLWGSLFFAAHTIRASAQAAASSAQSAGAQIDRISYQERIAALAVDTEAERKKLEDSVGADVVSIINTLEAAGTSVHVPVSINDAQEEGSAQDLPGGGSLHALGFIVEAHGTYAALMRLETVFETLPLVSHVKGVELQALQDPKTPWHMTLRVRVYTTASISS